MQDCFLTPVSSCIPRLDIELFTVCYVQEWSCWCWGISTLLRSFPITKKMTNYPSLPIGWRWKWVRGLWELCGWKHRHRIVRHLRRGCWRERESVTLCNRIVTQLPDHICPTLLMVAAKNCELVYFCARIRNYYASEIQGLDSYGGGGSFVRCFQEHLHEDIWWNSVSFTLTMKESDLKQIHELRLAVWLGQK